MLEDVVDKEAGLKPKLVTPTAPAAVGSAVRHIGQDELDAYISGRLAGARLDICRNHLDVCEECRAALEDLRTFKASAVGLSQASSLKRELDRRQRQRQLKTAATALVAAAVVAAIGMVGWNKFGREWVHSATAAIARARNVAPASEQATPAHSTEAPPQQDTVFAQARDTRVADASPHTQPRATPVPQTRVAALASAQTVATLPTRTAQVAMAAAAPTSSAAQLEAQPRIATTSVGARASAPVPPTGLAHSGAAAAGVTPGSTSFALLGPFGDEVTDDRPEFAWQPLAGATKYSIIVVDEGLRPIAHTRLKTTTWRPKKPLRRGRSYLWQVTAILKNGTKVMATGPSSQEARIHITAPGK